MIVRNCVLCLVLAGAAGRLPAGPEVLTPRMHHLRIDGPREWSSFPEQPEAASLELTFDGSPNATEASLRLRQQDVKQTWRVKLNDRVLGQLIQDENDLVLILPVPAGAIVAGTNTLRIEQNVGARAVPDDIRVGEISVDRRPMQDALTEATLDIRVTDETKSAVPCRLTIVDGDGSLQPLHVEPSPRLAVRTGVVYTADGTAHCGLPAGQYTVYANRGFEYSLVKADVDLATGDAKQLSLAIRREVPTAGWVACDTHIHTLTHSGHGDASIEERMVTLAGEGIELAIATDHNVQIDYRPIAAKVGVSEFFTPVVGSEYTTPVGHFNLFPLEANGMRPDPDVRTWPAAFEQIQRTGAKVMILNHARDLHSGFRPFGPEHFNAAVGTQLDGWPIGFNAMEVVNSGATQTDYLRLFQDWMTLLNAGHHIAPIGGSDSHDVTRFLVGQGRTYIRCDDANVAAIDVPQAVESIRAGRVRVSYGLLTELTVADTGPGELAKPTADEFKVSLRVLGPSWVKADRIALFANGVLVRDQRITEVIQKELTDGVKFEDNWILPKPKHDVHLVAIASGPGIDAPYWPTAKPYQPTSPDWTSHVIGCSGAVWIDGDGDGKKTSAREYAQRACDAAKGDLDLVVELLNEYDEAVGAQAAAIFHAKQGASAESAIREASMTAPKNVRDGFRSYLDAQRDSDAARLTSGRP